MDNNKLNKYDREVIHRLYHSYKNENALVYVILLSLFCIILKNAIIYEIIIWFIYYEYCTYNNGQLDKNSEIQRKRQYYKEKYGVGREI